MSFCPNPRDIPLIPGVTSIVSQADRDAAYEAEKESSDAEKEKLFASIEDITNAKGYENFLRDYESCDPQQRLLVDAIAESGSQGYRILRASACAGSGKTRCVTLGAAKAYHRFLRREPGGMSPNEMVLTTFTRKAAADLTRKLAKYIPKGVIWGMRVGTYHSMPFKSLPPSVLPPRDFKFGKALVREHVNSLLNPHVTARSEHRQVDPGRPFSDVEVYGQADMRAYRFTVTTTDSFGRETSQTGKTVFDAFKDAPKTIARKFESIVQGQLQSRNINSYKELKAYMEAYEAKPPSKGDPDYTRYQDVKRYWEELVDGLTEPGVSPSGAELAIQLWRQSNELKRRRYRLTADDLLIAYYRNVKVSKKAKLFIVDEAQDNTWIQVNIAAEVARMSEGTCLLIGDSRQAVYSFRGADPSMFELITQRPETQKYEISSNYRSGHWIVEAGNITATYETYVANDEGVKVKTERYEWASGTPAVSMRITGPNEVSYGGTLGEKFQGQVTLTMVDSKGLPLSEAQREEVEKAALERVEKEAEKESLAGRRKFKPSASDIGISKFIAEKIYDEVVRNGRPLTDFAVVSRTNAPLALVERALTRRGLKAMYARETQGVLEGKAATRYFMLLALAAKSIEDPEAAKEALMGILKNDESKFFGGRFKYLPSGSVNKVFRDRWRGGESGIVPMLRGGLHKLVTSKRDAAFDDFLTVADELEELCDAKWEDAPIIAMNLLREWEELPMGDGEEEEGEEETSEEGGGSNSSAVEIYTTMKDLAEQFQDFKSFMEYIKGGREGKNKNPDDSQEEKPKDAVSLTTAHSSKGLEWPTVFVLADREWPRKKSTRSEREEQVRLFYVAVTRAENVVYMVCGKEGASGLATRAIRKITALQLRQREEAQRAARLREIEVIEGPSGYEIFKEGRRYAITVDGLIVSSWPTSEEAIEAYLVPHEEAPRPMADRVDTFILWLNQNAPEVALRVQVHPAYRQLVSAIIADDLSTERLGWRRLGDLFPDVSGDTLRIRFGDRTIGYLVRSPQMVFHGYMELRAPFNEYTVEVIPREQVNVRYGSLFADDSLALLDARSVYGTLVPEQRERPGSAINLDQPEERPMLDRPLEQVGETAAEILTAQSVPLNNLGTPIAFGEVPTPVARVRRIRKLVRVELPKRRGIEDSATGAFNYLLHIISPGGTYVGNFTLSLEPRSGEKVRSYYMLEGSTLTYDTGSALEIYTVSAGDGFAGVLHPMMTLEIPPGTNSLSMLPAMDLTAFAAQQTDDLVLDFLDTPGIGVRDLLLWGAGLGKALTFKGAPGNLTLDMAHPYGVPPTIKTTKFGSELKIYSLGDYLHASALTEGGSRTTVYSGFNLAALTSSGWFSVVSESTLGTTVEWVQEKVGPALPA
jgi:superfamily I DNA/RNA helicase